MNVLKRLDALAVFPRSKDGPIPCMILDGHESRLSPQFLQYVNNPNHRWGIWLGLPYTTNLWQVGDAPEQNGVLKVEWYRLKEQLVRFKLDHGLNPNLHAEDIVPLVNNFFLKHLVK